MGDYEKRKLRIFNLLNFFQLLTGILVPALGLVQNYNLPSLVWLVASIPAFVSVLVLWLMLTMAGLFMPLLTVITSLQGSGGP